MKLITRFLEALKEKSSWVAIFSMVAYFYGGAVNPELQGVIEGLAMGIAGFALYWIKPSAK